MQEKTLLPGNDCGLAMGDYCLMVKNPRSRRVTAVASQAAGAASSEDEEPFYFGAWLEALGVKAAKVAVATGINEGYLSQLASGKKSNPGIAVRKKIGKALDMDWKLLYAPPPNRASLDELNKFGAALIERLSRHRKG